MCLHLPVGLLGRKYLASHPQLDTGLRGTQKTSFFLASRHDHHEVCALLKALEAGLHTAFPSQLNLRI